MSFLVGIKEKRPPKPAAAIQRNLEGNLSIFLPRACGSNL